MLTCLCNSPRCFGICVPLKVVQTPWQLHQEQSRIKDMQGCSTGRRKVSLLLASILEFTSSHSWKDSRVLLPPSESGSTLHGGIAMHSCESRRVSGEVSETADKRVHSDVVANPDCSIDTSNRWEPADVPAE